MARGIEPSQSEVPAWEHSSQHPIENCDGIEKLESMLRMTPAVVWCADAHPFRFKYVSRYIGDLLGYRPEKWTSAASFWEEHVHPDDLASVVAKREGAVESGGSYDVEYRKVDSEGTLRWVRELGRVSRGGADPELTGVIVDLSEKRAAMRVLGEDKRWLRQLIDTIPAQIWSGPANGGLDFCNARWRNDLGLTLEEIQGDGWQKMLHPDDVPRVLAAWNKSVHTGEPYEQQERHRMADGTFRWFLCRGTPLRDENGNVIRWFGCNTDIHGQKQAEDRFRVLLSLSHQFVSKLEVRELFVTVMERVRELGWDWATILVPDTVSGRLIVKLSPRNAYLKEGDVLPVDASLQGEVYKTGRAAAFSIEDLPALCPVFSAVPEYHKIARAEGIRAGCALPLVHEGRTIGALFLLTRHGYDFVADQFQFVQDIAGLVAAALHNSLQFENVNASQAQLLSEREYIKEQVRRAGGFEEIIGRSKALNDVLRQIEAVAPTDSTVLILGESGTGKELIARAVHDRSARAHKSFIKVDSTAIAANLMESELFGHERGAFTGAIAQKLGRFETADQGTLFLDEIGDLPLELQAKLLRVLQDRSFERVGSNRTRYLDVRIVAATNRDLELMVEAGKFREDLYYRLKVFPITIPPLRDRPEDITPLVQHYVEKYSQRMKKRIMAIPTGVMEVFERYPWPGNVRELQHLVERSVVISKGPVLEAPIGELQHSITRRLSARKHRTLEEVERESILDALNNSDWVIGGPHGAAAKLGIKRTTLASRMEKLGITRPKRQAS